MGAAKAETVDSSAQEMQGTAQRSGQSVEDQREDQRLAALYQLVAYQRESLIRRRARGSGARAR